MYSQIMKRIEESNSIAILSHVMPDGDSIGSSIALFLSLVSIEKSVDIIVDDEVPDVYKFLDSFEKIQRAGFNKDYDTVFVLDCGDIERLGKAKQYIDNTYLINIDHHPSNTKFGTVNIINSEASATAEIIYDIILNMKLSINKNVAEALYTGISTDTGHFQYCNTSSKTHRITSDLVNYGLNVTDIYRKLYQNISKEKLLLLGKALGTLKFSYNDKISYAYLTKNQVIDCNAKDSDSDGIISHIRDINNVEVAIFFREIEENKIKVGLRSKSYIDVCEIAQSFGGGGHLRASGFTVYDCLDDVIEKVLTEVIRKFQAVSEY